MIVKTRRIKSTIKNFAGAERAVALQKAAIGLLLVLTSVSASGTDLSVVHSIKSPTRLARGPEGKIYVTDPKVGSVFIHDPSLSVIGELKYQNAPLGIAIGVDGTMYVGSRGAKAVRVHDENGDFKRNIGAGILHMPSDIALDLYGNLYVADSPAHRIRVFNMNGGHLGDIGSHGTADGEFRFPVSVDVAYRTNATGQAVGELFVADQGNDRFQVFDLHGKLLRVLDLPPLGNFGDAIGKVGTLQSIAIDNDYQIHALDTFSGKIQVWDADTGAYKGINYGGHGTTAGMINLGLDILITDPANGTNSVIVGSSADGRVENIRQQATLGDIQLSASPVAESAPQGTTVGTLSLSPAPGGPVTYMLAAPTWPYDNAFFEIDGTNVNTARALDFEQITNMQIRVVAAGTNSSNLILAQTVTLTVTDINEVPSDLQLTSSYVLEGQPSSTLVGTFSAYDEDQSDTQSYSLASGSGDTGNANFSIDGANLMAQTTFDHSVTTQSSIRVSVTDLGGLAETNVFLIDIYPTNSIGEADLDGDGISDWWEADFDSVITDLDPALDTDGDGVINIDEWIAGTDPFNAAAVFEVEDQAEDESTGDFVLVWRGQYHRTYSVYWTSNLLDSMQLLANGLEGTPPWNSYTDTVHTAETKGFYRLKVEHSQ